MAETYEAAYTGALGGIASQRIMTSLVSDDYAEICAAAAAFAEQIQTAIPGSEWTADQLEALRHICHGYWSSRVPLSAVTTFYENAANVIAAFFTKAIGYL